jgi:hypothetical protein
MLFTKLSGRTAAYDRAMFDAAASAVHTALPCPA